MTTTPLVSIITATYNRSNILKYTLSSLIKSDFDNWECIVVGDACTDDSAETIASLNEPRIRWVNLNQNSGEQSGPNNYGCTLARGDYIAFLNHDDLWFPDHLSTCLKYIQKWRCDLVYPISAAYDETGRVRVTCLSHSGRFEPYATVFASSWLFRRRLLQEVGPWYAFRKTHSEPSYNWLLRASKKGKDLRMVPRITVVLVPSGRRLNSYRDREAGDNRIIFQKMTDDPSFRERLYLEALLSAAEQDRPLGIKFNLRRLFKAVYYRAALWLGLSPRAISLFLRYRRHGGFLAYLRRNRGLKRQ